MRTLPLALTLALALGPAAAAQTEPAPAPARAAEKQPIYDEKADAKALIDAALARAARENRRVLVQWGANWCHWCRLLHGTCTTDAKIKRELSYEYDVVLIDVGRFDRNMELAAACGANLKNSGIPYLTVLDAAGKPVVNQETSSLEVPGKEEHDPKKVLDFLSTHKAPYLSDEERL